MENNQFEEDRLIFVRQMESFFRQKMFPEALSLSEERLARFPLDVDAGVFVNRVLIELGKIEESRNVLRILEKEIAKLSFVYLRAAECYEEQGLTPDAVLCYQKFVSLNPLSADVGAIAEKISLLQKEQSPTGAVDESDEGEDELKPEFYTVTLADLYIKQGHLQMAADVLAEIIRKDPVNVQARVKLDTVKAVIARKSSPGDTIPVTDNLIKTLSGWLDNISRLKNHAT